ncbi:WD40/YVTN/BNR-like repeat-containing protein, partial [Oceanithermus sp.]
MQRRVVGILILVLALAAAITGCSQPPGSFAVTLDNSTVAVPQGETGQALLTITPQNGFQGTVDLVLQMQDGSQAPAGFAVEPNSVSVSGNEPVATIVSFAAPADMPASLQHMRLLAVSGSTRAEVSFDMDVKPSGRHWTQRGIPFRGMTYGTRFVGVGLNYVGTSDDGVNWESRPLDITSPLNKVAYGGGVYVAVGDDGIIFTSSDGVSWTLQESGVVSNLHGVTYGNGLFVAVGSGGTVLTSSDGKTWTDQTAGSGTTYSLCSVAYGDGLFVAVGDVGTVLTSTDGANWTDQTAGSGTTSPLCDVTYGVVNGNGLFVAVGSFGTIVTSPDGANWTAVNSPVTDLLDSVIYDAGGGLFVAVGASSIVTSSDGSTWTPQTVPGGVSDLHSVASNGSLYVAGGAYGSVLTSEDATTWTLVTRSLPWPSDAAFGNDAFVIVGGTSITRSADGAHWLPQANPAGNDLYGVTYGASGFVAVGDSGTIVTSSDGANWTDRTASSGTTNDLYSVAYGGGVYVAVGDGGTIVTSSDGASWTDRTASSGTTNDLYGIAYGNGLFVAAGAGGTVLTSTDGANWTPHYTGIND